MGLFDLFKKKKPRTMLDEVQDKSVLLFRNMGRENGGSPSDKMTDKEILQIAQEVMTAFKEASKQKGEHIPGRYLITITMGFFMIYEDMGKDMYDEHLNYEVNKYLNEGLRETYKI